MVVDFELIFGADRAFYAVFEPYFKKIREIQVGPIIFLDFFALKP